MSVEGFELLIGGMENFWGQMYLFSLFFPSETLGYATCLCRNKLREEVFNHVYQNLKYVSEYVHLFSEYLILAVWKYKLNL
jgi:hypothetical protein